MQLLQDKRQLLDKVSSLLLEKEVLEGDVFEQVVQGDAHPVG